MEAASHQSYFHEELKTTIEILKTENDPVSQDLIEKLVTITSCPKTKTSYDKDNLIAFIQNLQPQDLVLGFQGLPHPEAPESGAYCIVRLFEDGPKIVGIFTGALVREKHLPRLFSHFLSIYFNTKDIVFAHNLSIRSAWIKQFIIGGVNAGASTLPPEKRASLSPIAQYTNHLLQGLHFHYDPIPYTDSTVYPIESVGSNPAPVLFNPLQKNPVVILTIAIPGAGKNTVLESLNRELFLDRFLMIDIDDFVVPYLPSDAYGKAWLDVEKARDKALSQGRNILLPTTLQNIRNLEVLKEAIHRSGNPYRIVFVRVTTDTDLAVERSQDRALRTKREPVPRQYMDHCVEQIEGNNLILQMGKEMGFPTLNFDNSSDAPRLRSVAYFKGATPSQEAMDWQSINGEETFWTLDRDGNPKKIQDLSHEETQALLAALYGFRKR